LRWGGGEHWYAKIGIIDIVDENGNQKWNTYGEAKQASLDYINRNYPKK